METGSDYLFFLSSIPTQENEEREVIESVRKNWKKIGMTEDGGTIYRTPAGKFTAYEENGTLKRLTRILDE